MTALICVTRPLRRWTLVMAGPLLLAGTSAQATSEDDWATASDIGVGSLALWSLGVPVAQGDMPGALQAGGSMLVGTAVTQGLKTAFPEQRPDGSGDDSFPSGHTAVAFAAATSILDRRGLAEGIPALALASFVGVARVKADKHHWYDVVVGAAVGSASGLLLTHNHSKTAKAIVWGDVHSAGVTYVARF